MSYAFESQVKKLEERIRVLEKAVGAEQLAAAIQNLEYEGRDKCALGQHVYEQTSYDLQGGKWGEEVCTRCKTKRTWGYESGSGKYRETVTPPPE